MTDDDKLMLNEMMQRSAAFDGVTWLQEYILENTDLITEAYQLSSAMYQYSQYNDDDGWRDQLGEWCDRARCCVTLVMTGNKKRNIASHELFTLANTISDLV